MVRGGMQICFPLLRWVWVGGDRRSWDPGVEGVNFTCAFVSFGVSLSEIRTGRLHWPSPPVWGQGEKPLTWGRSRCVFTASTLRKMDSTWQPAITP